MLDHLSKNKVLAICGVSGSGKSVLERNLIEEFPDLFYKWQQFSTRKKRSPNETSYVFVQPDTFDKFAPLLTAKISGGQNSLYGKDMYGSIPDFKDGHVSTVIVNEEGLLSLIADVTEGRLDASIFVLGLDITADQLAPDARREGRDEGLLERERQVLRHCDYVYKNENGRYLNPADVVEVLKEKGFIKSGDKLRIEMPRAEMLMTLRSPSTGEARVFHPDQVKKAIMESGKARVVLEMYDEDGENDGDTIVIEEIDVITFKIISSLGTDGAFEIEFLD